MEIETYRPPRSPRCRAHRTNGDACSAFAIHGGAVCHAHGGRAPQVKRAAEERLKALVDPAIAELEQLLSHDYAHIRLAAVKDVLDRNGLGAKQKHELSGEAVFTLRIDRANADDPD